MNAITSGMGHSPLQIGSRGTESAPAAAPAPCAPPSPAIDTQAHSGQGALRGHTVAVGNGQTTKRMQEGGETKTLLASASPAVGKMLAQGSEGTELKGRQVGHGDGQGTSLLHKAGATLRSVLSGLSDMLKAVLQAPLSLIKAAMGHGAQAPVEAPLRTTFLEPEEAAAFDASVTTLTGVLASKEMVDTNPVNGYFGGEVLPPATLAPAGVHKQAIKDWVREGVTIEGKSYARNFAGVSQAAKKLVELCGGNANAANWISRYANQQALGPLAIEAGKLKMGPNGESGFMFLGGRPGFEIKSLEDGSVEVIISQKWTPGETNLTQHYTPVDVVSDFFQRDVEISYALAFTMPETNSEDPPRAKVSQPFQARELTPMPAAAEPASAG